MLTSMLHYESLSPPPPALSSFSPTHSLSAHPWTIRKNLFLKEEKHARQTPWTLGCFLSGCCLARNTFKKKSLDAGILAGQELQSKGCKKIIPSPRPRHTHNIWLALQSYNVSPARLSRLAFQEPDFTEVPNDVEMDFQMHPASA